MVERMNAEPNHDRVAYGGKAIYGARLGILMLEARFPRIPGDMGNAETWPFPVLYKVVKGASPQRVVMERASGLRDAFLAAARELVDLGADGITTNCGFLSLFQADIACRVGVPVATSSLMQAPMIERLLPVGRRVGIVTVNVKTLGGGSGTRHAGGGYRRWARVHPGYSRQRGAPRRGGGGARRP